MQRLKAFIAEPAIARLPPQSFYGGLLVATEQAAMFQALHRHTEERLGHECSPRCLCEGAEGESGLRREQPKRAVEAGREPGDDDARVPLEPLGPAVHHDLEAGRVRAAIIPILCNRCCHMVTAERQQTHGSSALPLTPSTVTFKLSGSELQDHRYILELQDSTSEALMGTAKCRAGSKERRDRLAGQQLPALQQRDQACWSYRRGGRCSRRKLQAIWFM